MFVLSYADDLVIKGTDAVCIHQFITLAFQFSVNDLEHLTLLVVRLFLLLTFFFFLFPTQININDLLEKHRWLTPNQLPNQFLQSRCDTS